MASEFRNFKSETTLDSIIASVALNPKFAQGLAQALANFEFATLVQKENGREADSGSFALIQGT
jgi:hypothetical protein